MKSKLTTRLSPRSVLISVAALSIITAAGTAAGQQLTPLAQPQQLDPVTLDYSNTMASRLDELVEIFIRLDTASVAKYVAGEVNNGRKRPNKARQIKQYDAVMRQQTNFRKVLEKYEAEELSSLQVSANGFRVKVKLRDVTEISTLPGVVSVGLVPQYTPDNADSVPWVGAPAVWADLGEEGDGINIAVIDTGIDYTHANFGGPGTPAAYAGNDPDIIVGGDFPTAKVTFGHDFVGTAYDGSNTPIPDDDPLDENFHGSHVSGSAAGLGVGPGPGVAKGASLWALKVFGVTGFTTVVSDAIELALDPNEDGSVDDHADVINMSLGSLFGSPASGSAIASQNASDLGIIVVASAGNSGDAPYVTGSPAVAADVISVAASTPGNRLQATLEVTAPASLAGFKPALEGAGPVRIESVAPFPGTLAPVMSETPIPPPGEDPPPPAIMGCLPLENAADVAGNIALVKRGACNFSVKYDNAAAAGATAILVYNDGTSPGRQDPITMGGVGGTTIPGLMTSFTAGDALNTAIAGGDTATVTLDVEPNDLFADTLTGFSSRGPGHGGTTFKPDVGAPGDSIVSTGFTTGDGTITASGTSMASPHVAGQAALLRALHPDLLPTDIKALIQNSTVTAHVDGLGGSVAFPLAKQGTGIIRVDQSAHLSSFAKPGGVSFGRVNSSSTGKSDADVTITNLTGQARSYTVTHVPNHTLPGVTVSANKGVVHVPAHGSAGLRLELSAVAPHGALDLGEFSQSEVDGWFMLNDGTDNLRVGYMGAVDPASDIDVTQRRKGGIRVHNGSAAAGIVQVFSLAGEDGLVLDGLPQAIKGFGFRNSFGVLVEFGVTTEVPWETASAFEFDIFVDADGDGIFETALVAADLGLLQGIDPTGEIVTAIFSPTVGALLFFADGDLNDSSIVLPFFTDHPVLGFLAPGDTDFDYVLVTTDLRTGVADVQFGSIDLADETVPVLGGSELSAFIMPSGAVAGFRAVGGSGELLWQIPTNTAATESQTTR